MFVEYLFEINPATLLLIILTILFLIKQRTRNIDSLKSEVKFEETQITYKNYETLPPNEQKQKTILVMSYNVLAYYFTKAEYFPYCPEEYLHVKYRSPRIVNEIEKVNPDVLSLQECDFDLFSEYYLPNLTALGYVCHYKASSSNRIVINVVCYKKSLFTLEEEYKIDLNEELNKKDEAFNKFKDATVINMKHNPSGKRVVIVNTHLYWNPEFEYIKYGQLSKIIKDIEKKYSASVPMILCGDFNSLPNSNVIKYVYGIAPDIDNIKKGEIEKNKKFISELWEEYKHNLDLRSAYDSYKKDKIIEKYDYANNHPDFTVYTEEFIGNLDYIIYSTKHFKITQLLDIPINDPNVRTFKSPNKVYPSDHFKIAARFQFV